MAKATVSTGVVRDHIPLEQGLRQMKDVVKDVSEVSQRPYSIRTRIKTRWQQSNRSCLS